MSPIDCSSIGLASALSSVLWDETMELKRAFGLTLKRMRIEKGLTQEDFSLVSSRTYLSTLERGLKCPTLEKLEDLAAVIGVHPVTLLVAVYTREGGVEAQDALLQEVKTQLK
jgi:transcriptional regulator with XRE-family HTH domain